MEDAQVRMMPSEKLTAQPRFQTAYFSYLRVRFFIRRYGYSVETGVTVYYGTVRPSEKLPVARHSPPDSCLHILFADLLTMPEKLRKSKRFEELKGRLKTFQTAFNRANTAQAYSKQPSVLHVHAPRFSNTATAGSSLPSKNSRNAPPPVEI